MKTRTVIAALLIVGISLNLSAQNKGKPHQHFAPYKTFTATVSLPNAHNDHLYNGGFRLQILENKARKTFAELNDLGEGFNVELTLTSIKDWLVEEDLLILTKAQKNKIMPPVERYENPDWDRY